MLRAAKAKRDKSARRSEPLSDSELLEQAKEPGSTGQLDDMSVVIVVVRERK